jgi:hypothetical protein
MGMGKIRRQRTEHSAVMSTPPARKFFVIVGLVLLAFSTLLSSFACSNGEEGALIHDSGAQPVDDYQFCSW